MTQIIVNRGTVFKSRQLCPGDMIDIDERICQRWVKHGIAHFPTEPIKTESINNYINQNIKNVSCRGISIIVPVKDTLKYFNIFAESLKNTSSKFELIIVDNGSGKANLDYYGSLNFDVKLIKNTDNRGVPYSWNQGLAVAKYPYIVIANSDVCFAKDWDIELLKAFEYDGCGIAGPTSSYTAKPQCDDVVKAKRNSMSFTDIETYASTLKSKFVETEVYGFCFMLSKDVIDKIGAFDYKRYGQGQFEETDYFWRAKQVGFKSYWACGSYVHHWGSKTYIESKVNPGVNYNKNKRVFIARKADSNLFIENDVEVGEVISKPRIGFVTLQHIETDKVASTRLRVEWPLRYMPGSFESEDYNELKTCDAVVFQSRHECPDIELARKLKKDGAKLIWDFTDPHWLKEYDPNAVHPIFYDIAKLADCVTLPTQEEARTYKATFPGVPVEIIKDRLELSQYTKVKVHKEHKNFKICWHGSYGNFSSIDLAREDLERLGKEFNITFICVYDTGNKHNIQLKPFKNLKVDIRTWTNQVTTDACLGSDVTINPKFDNHWKSYKSNNKTITSWACGVPCVERNFYSEIKKYLLSAELRNNETKVYRKLVEKEYDAKLTAKEWIDLATRLTNKKVKVKNNIVAYTAICGNRDSLRNDQYIDGAVDYVAFLDDKVQSGTWETKKIFRQFVDPSRQAKIYKVLPWLYMDYEYSIWIDGCVCLKVSPKELIDTYLKDTDIAMFKHHSRDDIYDEYKADFKFLHRKLEPEYLFKWQIDKYKKEDFPQHSGLFECTVILRRHTESVKRAMLDWWAEICAYTVSDQCSFNYVVRKHNLKITTVPGTVLDNKFFDRGKREYTK